MSANKDLTEEEVRAAWLAARRQGISASDVAPIVGLYAYGRTAYTVYCEKRGLIPETEASEAMIFGKEIEQIVARKWAKKNPTFAVSWLDTLVIGPEPWMVSTPDAMVSSYAGIEGLEVKTTGYRSLDEWGDEGTDQIPERYLTQVTWQMLVNQWDAVNVALFETGKRKLWSYKVYLDKALGQSLVQRCREFWFQHVLTGIPPEIDWSDAASAYLKARFPTATFEEKEASVEQEILIRTYVDLGKKLKDLEREKKTVGNKIREQMGESQILKGNGFKASYANVAGSTYTVTREPGRQLRISGAITKGEE